MNFKTLDISDFDTLKAFLVDQPYSLSVYSPASLIAWNVQIFRSQYLQKEGILFVAGDPEEHPENRHLILPIAGAKIHSPAELHRFARELGFGQYWYAPGDYVEAVDQSELHALFIVEEQMGFSDYVYRTEDLSKLSGNRYSKKRNLISQFAREYLRKGRVKVEDIHLDSSDECIKFLEIWCEQNSCDDAAESTLACEKAALIATLGNIDRLESKGILIRIDDAVSALGIGSRLNRTTGTLNFEKAFSGIKGLYQFLDNECAKRLFSAFEFINKESDMNIPNLAEAKQSYHPALRIKSFSLTLR
jgi:hypothetical protein